MGKRFRDTTKYDKEWYMNLPPRLKCAVDFLHDKADNAGIWEPNYVLLNTAVRDKKKIHEFEILTIDHGRQFLKLDSGKIYCIGFIEFQYGELSQKCKPHHQIFKSLEKNKVDLEKIKGYGKGIHTHKDWDKDKDWEKDWEKEKQVSLIFPFDSIEFINAWGILVKEKNWKDKSHSALQAALKILSNYPENQAIKMIEAAIAGEWKGIHEIKSNQINPNGEFTREEIERSVANARGTA